jgi:hypothetical protein
MSIDEVLQLRRHIAKLKVAPPAQFGRDIG